MSLVLADIQAQLRVLESKVETLQEQVQELTPRTQDPKITKLLAGHSIFGDVIHEIPVKFYKLWGPTVPEPGISECIDTLVEYCTLSTVPKQVAIGNLLRRAFDGEQVHHETISKVMKEHKVNKKIIDIYMGEYMRRRLTKALILLDFNIKLKMKPECV